MSLINLFVTARAALARRREQRRAYHELMALDDRSLADIGIHRSQIPAMIEGFDLVPRQRSRSCSADASARGAGAPLAVRPVMPPL